MGIVAEVLLIISIIWNIFKFFIILILFLPLRILVLFFTFLFSPRAIFAIVIIILLSLFITEFHNEVIDGINEVYCDSFDFREVLSSITIFLGDFVDKIICIWNLIVTIIFSPITAFLNLTVECELIEDLLIDTIFLIEGIINSFFEFIINIGTADFNILSIWTDVQNLLGTIVSFFDCSCNDLTIFIEKFINMIRSDGLGIALHHYFNFFVKAIQFTIRYALNIDQSIDFIFLFNYLCDSIKGLGIFLDDAQRIFFSFFAEDPLDNNDDSIVGIELNIGCILSRILCLAIESIAILIQTIWNIIFINNTTEIDLSSIFLNISEIAACLRETLLLFDECLADVVFNLIEILKELGIIIINLFENPDSVDFTNLLERYIHFLGKDQYFPSETHVSFFNSDVHLNPKNQTSLACLIGRLFIIKIGTCVTEIDKTNIICEKTSECNFGLCQSGPLGSPPMCQFGDDIPCFSNAQCLGVCDLIVDTECTSKAIGDLVVNLINLLSLPFYIIDKMEKFDGTGYNARDNPFDSGNIDITNEFLSIIISEVIDRYMIGYDNFAHLLQCSPFIGFRILGDVIIDLLALANDVLEEVKILLITAIELIIQFIIMIFSIFGGSPFTESWGEEIILFFELLGDFVIEILDVLLFLLEFFVNFILFPWFPAIFGQNTLYQNNPGTATLTECVSHIEDCICGITKQITKVVCLPLDLGCLSEFWPNCGAFNKRSFTTIEYGNWPNSTVFEYWADTFNTSMCSSTFNKWRNGPPSEKVSEFETLQYLTCIGFVFQNLKIVNNSNVSVFGNHDHFVNIEKLKSTANQTVKGMEVMMAYEFVDLLNNLRNPDSYDIYSGSKKINTKTYSKKSDNRNLINFSDMLKSKNITDIFALENIKSAKNKLDNFKLIYSQKPRITKKNSIVYNMYNVTVDSIYIFSRIAHEINEKDIFPRLWDSFGKISEDIINTRNNDNKRKRNEEIIIDNNNIKIKYSRTTSQINKQKHMLSLHNVYNGYVKQFTSNDYMKDLCIEFNYDCSNPNIDNCNQMAKLKANSIDNCYPYFGYSIQVNCEDNFQIIHVFNDTYCSAYIEHFIAYGTEEFCFEFGSDYICMYGNLCKPCYNIELQIFENLNCSYFTEIAGLVSNATKNCLKKFNLIDREDVKFNDTIHTTITNFTIPIGNDTRIGTKCGNDVRDPGEQCDDGNRMNGDGCTNLCFSERCGNNITQAGETCDDGNRINDDGCDSNCQIEIGCGDGIIERAEQCDDGNLNNGDGCNDLCQLESCGSFTLNSFPNNNDICKTNIITLNNPKSEFNVNGKSFHMNCFASFPVVSIHDDINGFGNIIESIKIDSVCGFQKGFCFDTPIPVDGSCDNFVSFGSDFSCSKNCSICGDKIVDTNNGEECDDGHLQGGGPDNCTRCLKGCECSSDDINVCFGKCIGGHNGGSTCNPRRDNRNIIPDVNITFNQSFFNNKGLIFFGADGKLFSRSTGCILCSTIFDGTDISVSNRRWIAQSTENPDGSVFLISDNGHLLSRCPSCNPSSGCEDIAIVFPTFLQIENDPTLLPEVSWIIESLGIGDLVAIKNVQSGKYIRKHNNIGKIGCISSIDPNIDAEAQFVVEIVGIGEECSDGGGICLARSCCGDSIIQTVSFPANTVIPELGFDDYSESCDDLNNDDDNECFNCRIVKTCICDKIIEDVTQLPITQTVTTGEIIESFHPCLGRCYFGKFDGQKCLAFPTNHDQFINNFGINETILNQKSILVNCSGITDGFPDSGVCIPTLCCNEEDPSVNNFFELVNFIPSGETEHQQKRCNDGELSNFNYRDTFPKDSCFEPLGPRVERCEWECCMFDGILPVDSGDFKRKRDYVVNYNNLINDDNNEDIKNNIIHLNENLYDQLIENNLHKGLRKLYFELNDTPTKSNSLKEIFIDIFEAIGELFVGESVDIEQWFIDNVIGFFTNTNTDPDASLDEVGLIWYINFLVRCDINRNLCCQRGLGFWPAIGIFLLVGITLGLASFCFFGSLNLCASAFFVIMSFIGVAFIGFFYSPACFPRLPECLMEEILLPLNHLGNASLPWPDSSVIKINTSSLSSFLINENDLKPELVLQNVANCSACDLVAVDCKQIGFIDGFDNLVFLLEVNTPGFMESFRDSIFFNILNIFEFAQIAFNRFNYKGTTPPDVDFYCNSITILSLSQIFYVPFVLVIAFILLLILIKLISIIFVIMNRIIKYNIIKNGDERDESIEDLFNVIKLNKLKVDPSALIARENFVFKDISLTGKIRNKFKKYFAFKDKRE